MSIKSVTTHTLHCNRCPTCVELSNEDNMLGYMPEGWGIISLTVAQKGTLSEKGRVVRNKTPHVLLDLCPACMKLAIDLVKNQ